MKFATFEHHGRAAYGVVDGEELIVLSGDQQRPPTLKAALAAGLATLGTLADLRRSGRPRIALAQVRLLPPIPDPQKYMACGGNYASHAAEVKRLGIDHTTNQTWFNKQVSCIAGPYDEVHRPRISDQFDYEGELGLIIGRRCRNVPAADAFKVIAGYVVCNDLSVRDWQRRAQTGTLGKSFDTHGPFGPYLVTADEVPDPHALRLRTLVNGEVRQDASTGEMIHRLGALIEELTTAVTLEPGDLLATGTPAGVGGLRRPTAYLRAGDVVRVEIEGIGHLENRVIEEPTPESPLAPSVRAFPH